MSVLYLAGVDGLVWVVIYRSSKYIERPLSAVAPGMRLSVTAMEKTDTQIHYVRNREVPTADPHASKWETIFGH